MAKARPQPTSNHREALFTETSGLIDTLVDQARQGIITQDQLRDRIKIAFDAAKPLTAEAKGRLKLRVAQGVGKSDVPVAMGGPSRAIVPIQDAQQAAQSVRARVVKGSLMAAQEAQNAATKARALSEQIASATQSVGKMNVPGIFGSTVATAHPAVAPIMARLAEAKSPVSAANAYTEAVGAAQGAAAQGQRNRVLGRGIGGGLLAGLIGMKLFGSGKQEGIDPQIQLALAQRLGGGDQGGQSTSKTLMDASRLLTLIKNIQGMAGMQGPAARPQLI